MMRALVTGAGGFLGRHLVARLAADGHEVVALVRRPLAALADTARQVLADVRDEAAVIAAMAGCEVVFHCAALVGADTYAAKPVETMEVEVLGVQAVVHAAHRHGAKVVYPSSSAVYGPVANPLPLSEEAPLAPASAYAVAKRFNELYLAAQFRENGLRSASLRIFNVYGPGQDERLVIPRFLRQALAGGPLVIYGDGTQTRDFTYVGDVVEAAIRCAERTDGCEIINVAHGKPCSINALARTILEVTSSTVSIRHVPYPAGRQVLEVNHCVGSSAKLAALAGFFPSVSLDDGLRSTFAAMRPVSAALHDA